MSPNPLFARAPAGVPRTTRSADRRRLWLLVGMLACPVLPAGAAVAQESAPSEADRARIGRIERGLLVPVHVQGRPRTGMELADRMRRYRVPGVSVAVMEGGELVWARAWGLADVESTRPVEVDTRFQAASISKPLSAVAVLRRVQRGDLDLDEDVGPLIAPWRIARAKGIDGDITLRGLLSHTGGLTVHGFAGYAPGAPVPTTLEVLEGSGLANSPVVMADLTPGREWRYSGGGYTVAQYAIERRAGRPFEEEMRPILDALGMSASTYEQPLPDSLSDKAALGYRADGSAVTGGWHTYPEKAAAGLWTTPSDIARYALEVGRWWRGVRDGLLSPELTREMLSPGLNGWGLGPSTSGEGLDFRFQHSGANEGFRSQFVFYPNRGLGAVIMTNGDGGDPLIQELLLAIAEEYAWPEPRAREIRALPLDARAAREYAGRYRLEAAPDVGVLVRWRAGRLEIRVGDGPPSELIHVGRDRFVNATDGSPIRFERDPAGRIIAAFAYGSRARRVRPPGTMILGR